MYLRARPQALGARQGLPLPGRVPSRVFRTVPTRFSSRGPAGPRDCRGDSRGRCAILVRTRNPGYTPWAFVGLHPFFRQHALQAPRVPIGILAARPFARALRFLAVAVVCFESFVWPTAPAPAHVWVDFRGAWDLSAVALSTLARSASGAGCSVTVVGPATATAKTINTENLCMVSAKSQSSMLFPASGL